MAFIVYNYFISHNIALQIILYNVTKKKQNRQNGMGKSLTTVANYKEIRVLLIDINKDRFSLL